MLLFLSFSKPSDAQNSTNVYSTISGTVWKENTPVDGIHQANETGIPGMMVTMLDALTDRVIACGISDTAGHFLLKNYAGVGDYYLKYGYPEAGFTITAKRAGTDNEVNSAADPSTQTTDAFTIADTTTIDTLNLGLVPSANKITYCDAHSLSVTDWSTSFNFPKSNDAVTGTLTKVTLFIADAVWHPTIGVENTGAQAITTTLGFSGLLTLTPPTGGANEVTTTLLNKQVSLPAYDGLTDYGGLSGITWHNEFASIVDQNRTFTTTAQLNVFRGPSGTVSFPATAQNSFTITGGGNLENSVQTNVGAGACVTYEYAGGIILPISLTSFSASTPDGVSSLLNWETASELGNKGFAVERSTDSRNFSEIGFVNTKATNKEGVSYEKLSYEYRDMEPLQGQNYYRLKQEDINGKSTYSGIVKVQIGKQAGLSVYPNPADRYILISSQGLSKVSIYSVQGALVLQQTAKDGNESVKIDTSLLPTGTYSLQVVMSDGSVDMKKIIVTH
jgi:hypothetical protein